MITGTFDGDFLPMVLVVDDVVSNLDVAIGHLAREALDVRAAVSGEEGLELAKELQPDLILLDIMMPDISGYEVCRRLKQDAELRQIPVVFLSSLGEQKYIKQGFAVGGVDYLEKPFSAQAIRQSVWKHLAA